MLCITGANAEKVIYAWPGGDAANKVTLAEGVTVQITGNESKNIQSAKSITIDGTAYTSMKVSNGAENTLTLPKAAKSITFYSYVNKASDAEGLRDSYWKEVAGVSYDAETSGGLMSCFSDDLTKPDVRTYTFENPLSVITFTNAGEQLCYVIEVEYAEEGTEPVEPVTDLKTIYLLPGVWDKDGARYAAWSWNGELGNWYDFTPNNIDGRLSVQVPATNTGFIAVRMNGGTEENNWDNAWNQTADIDLTNVADGSIITITGWGENDFTISTEEPVENTYTVYFENNGNWAEVYAYAWYAAPEGETGFAEMLGNWPGTAMTKDADTGIYTISFTSPIEPTGIIFNNGGDLKTDDLVFENGKTYKYEAPEPVENTYTVYFENTGNWAKVFAYAWYAASGDETGLAQILGTWPGTEMEADAETGKLSITFTSGVEPTGIIFNNGVEGEGAIKTADLEFENGKTYKYEAPEPVGNTYTVKFENNGNWAEVYAYIFKRTVISDNEYADEPLNGVWPGQKVEATDEGYVFTYTGEEAPSFIVFSNGAGLQTADLEFVDGATYSYDAPVEPIIPDGTYYVMNAEAGTLVNAESVLDAKGTPITFTFDAATNTYAIEGNEFFKDKQWTIADAVEGMSGYYHISTVIDNVEMFVSVGALDGPVVPVLKSEAGEDAIWILLEKAYWEDIVNSTYTVAGTKNLTGTENDWDIVETNQMVLNEKTGLYEKKFKKIAVDGENQPEFKVVKTNMEGVNIWYPEGDNWKITTDYCGGEGLYDITITFDPSDFKEIGVIPDKRIVFPADAIVYDFEAAADAGENPANKNGSAANGQAFYGWENAEKTDSKRQDYKGYEWAEGSVLPEECHVWRRSDRINGNVAGNGGLKCPSNKEMAIDGLKAGDKVIIVYDAENASDKEIVWAIGDGTSEGGPGVVRATATINGVEAVTGETTIASGAEIIVNSVTPADNGSGYFVFQVKKGMVIQQIAVIPAPEPVETDYYLVGNMNDWTVSKDYMLVPNNGAPETEEYMFTLDLTTTSEFKIVKKDGETLIWYPEGEGNNYGQNGEITEDANYTVYFRPNYDGGEDWYYNCIYLVSNKEYEPIIPAGTYYVADMANDPLHFITDDGKLMCDGVPFEVTFDETTGTYGVQSNSIIGHYPLTIEEDAVYGHNISTTQNGVKVYLTANAMGTGVTFGTEPYAWALLPKEYVESDILSYTVAGTADLTGTDWTFVDANKMTKNAETGLFEIKYEGIEVTNEAKPEFKVVTRQYDDGIVVEGTEVWYPENNWVITPDYLGAEGKYTITITFNTTTKEIGVSGVKTGEPTGINGIYAEKLNNATIYNLNGQRIQNAQKGLYIINGRKVVVK